MTTEPNTQTTPDPDLARVNERVARAMGWQHILTAKVSYWRLINFVSVDCPDFARDWARCGELKDWLLAKGWYYRITISAPSSAKTGGRVEVVVHNGVSSYSEGPYVAFVAWRDTEPEALCRAVLALLDACPELGDSAGVGRGGDGEANP